MPPHLLFEGAELSGKSFLMSQVYPVLEKKFSESRDFLDGCIWFNSDNGVLGSQNAETVVEKYVDIAEIIQNRAVMFEKLHVSDSVYKILKGQPIPDYTKLEDRLSDLNFRIVFTTFSEDPGIISCRLKDRINLYPHYQKIARDPEYYFRQQQIYRSVIGKSFLPSLEISLHDFSKQEIKPLFDWIDE